MSVDVTPLPIEKIAEETSTNPSANAMWLSFGDNGTPHCLVGIREAAVQKLEEMETIRTAAQTAKERLATSETETAVAYRQQKERAAQAEQNAKAKFAAELEAATIALNLVKTKITDEVKAINERLKEVTAAALEAETGEVLGETDADEKAREYKLIADKFKAMRDVLIQTGGIEALKGYTLPGVGAAKGTNKGTVRSEGNEWRPRLETAAVNGVVVPSKGEHPTGTEVAKYLGVKLHAFQQNLETALNGRVAVPSDRDTEFVININNRDYTVVVRGREGKVAE